ncbi:7-deoxyloganetic acid glucosyltransferase-like [Cornus florida]|uniref:7-deoxyloganetic acid glucosyltransferase-like n=1 Tax=Cornus florida TaxID=4283 RepID=UPI00289A5861|nr:7-deoxyloganetic acid glucosyltransferase-like [Cornus florida]
MSKPVSCIPGFESLLRRRDLPSICRYEDVQNPPSDSSNGSLREQDRTCLTWLDCQPSKSVIYVSFGSLTILTREQLLEFWYGLVNSEKLFLLVIREGLIPEEDNKLVETPLDLLVGTRDRGCIVGWAPQEEVLTHRAVGGFLTHSGWNSTLESILAGVPMICWPQIADQQVNSRCVGELWKVGVDMKDICDRLTVEKMVRNLMDGKREKIMKSIAENSRMACDSVRDGGSSYCNLEKLIEDIRSMKSTKNASVKVLKA